MKMMKKTFFYALLFAVMGVLAGCQDPNNGENGKEPGGDVDAVAFDKCWISDMGEYAKEPGKNTYVIRMAILNADGEATSMANATLIAPPAEDGVKGKIAEGTYTIKDGSVVAGSIDKMYKGTYYLNYSEVNAKTTFIVATDATVTVKYVGDEIDLVVSISGTDLEGNKSWPTISGFTGTPTIMGSTYQDSFLNAHVLYATLVERVEGLLLWEISLYNEGHYAWDTGYLPAEEYLPARRLAFGVITADPGEEEAYLPAGTFDIDYIGSYALNAAFGTSYSYISGIDYEVNEDNSINVTALRGYEDLVTDGQIKITPSGVDTNGNSTYNVSGKLVGFQGDYEISVNKVPVFIYDETATELTLKDISAVECNYYGAVKDQQGNEYNPSWSVDIYEGEYGTPGNYNLYAETMFTQAGNTFEQCIPDGEYNIVKGQQILPSATNTIVAGELAFDGNYISAYTGALLWKCGEEGVYNMIDDAAASGTFSFTKTGEPVADNFETVYRYEDETGAIIEHETYVKRITVDYQINFSCVGHYYFTLIAGAYSGPVTMYDYVEFYTRLQDELGGTSEQPAAVMQKVQATIKQQQAEQKVLVKYGRNQAGPLTRALEMLPDTKGFSINPIR